MTGQELHDKRQSHHGDFINNAEAVGAIMRVLTAMPGWGKLDDIDELTLRMIVQKLGRACNGNAQFEDHWDDIEGYIVARRGAKKMQAQRKLESA